MIFSLPNYRRLPDEDLARLRKDDPRNPSRRLRGALLNILLLAGLWGLPFYGRSLVLSAMNETKGLREDIIGKWRISESGFLEFTPDQQVRLVSDRAVIETASYYFVGGDVVEISGFKRQPGDRDLEVQPQCYRVFIHGGQLLTVTTAPFGFTPVPENTAWERSRLRILLPMFHGASRQFRRAEEH